MRVKILDPLLGYVFIAQFFLYVYEYICIYIMMTSNIIIEERNRRDEIQFSKGLRLERTG